MISRRISLPIPFNRPTSSSCEAGPSNTQNAFELVPMQTFLQAGSRQGNAVVLQPLPPAPTAPRGHDSKRYVQRVGLVQIAQGHAAYKDTWAANFLAAKASVIDDGESRRDHRMAQNAGLALVRFETLGLVKMGVAEGTTQATDIVKALRKAGILDGKNQVSRGPAHAVDNDELITATRALRLSNEQNLKLRDAVMVVKFIYDFGIREASSLFDLETCCGANTFERPASWSEWGASVRHLFDNNADQSSRMQLQEARAAITARLQAAV